MHTHCINQTKKKKNLKSKQAEKCKEIRFINAKINEIEFYYMIEMINLAKNCIFEKTNKKARPLVILRLKKHEKMTLGIKIGT